MKPPSTLTLICLPSGTNPFCQLLPSPCPVGSSLGREATILVVAVAVSFYSHGVRPYYFGVTVKVMVMV